VAEHPSQPLSLALVHPWLTDVDPAVRHKAIEVLSLVQDQQVALSQLEAVLERADESDQKAAPAGAVDASLSTTGEPEGPTGSGLRL